MKSKTTEHYWLIFDSLNQQLKANVSRCKGVMAMSSFICSSLMAAGDVIITLLTTSSYKNRPR